MLTLHEPTLTKQDEDFILDALRSGWVSTGGKYVDQFERDFAEFVGAAFAVSVCNGTAGLHLALECMKRNIAHNGPFHVLTTTLTFAGTWNAIFQAGGTPVLVDVEDGTLNLSADALHRTIQDLYRFSPRQSAWFHRDTNVRLLAVLPAHIMGWTPDMAKILAICEHAKLPVIEDAAESLGSRYHDGTHVGLTGIASVFSFNGNKILTTGGGGMLVTQNAEIARLAKHISTTAKTDGLRYVHDQPGFNYRLVNLLAALGCSQLRDLPHRLREKAAIAQWYDAALEELPGVHLHKETACISNNWINNAVFASKDLRESALNILLAKDIQCRPLWTPGHRLPYVAQCQPTGFKPDNFPCADQIWNTALSLPSSAHLKQAEVQQVAGAIEMSCSPAGKVHHDPSLASFL